VAAAVGALLVVLSDRSSTASDAAVASNDYVVTAAARNAEPANLGLIAERSSSPTPVHAASPLAEARGPETRSPGPEPAPGPTANSQQPTASLAAAPEMRENSPDGSTSPAPTANAVVRLEGLPSDAQATLDGVAVGSELLLEVSDAPHTLRVVARGRKPFTHVFRVGGNTTIHVVLEQADATRREVAEPVVSAAPAATGASDPALRPLANPFTTP
jgi:hypothetical protein